MNYFNSYYWLELKQLVSRPGKKLIIMLVLLCFPIYFTRGGVHEYRDTVNRKTAFIETEQLKMSQYINYRQYGSFGIQFIFTPSIYSLFYTDYSIIPEIISSIDTGEGLNIYQPLKGNNIFKNQKSPFSDFSGFLIIFGTLMALFYGYEPLRRENFLKFQVTLCSEKNVYWGIVLSRLTILGIFLLLIFCSALLMASMLGVFIPITIHYIIFVIVLYGNWIFFFMLGTVFSAIKSRATAIPVMLLCWFALVIVIPAAIDSYIEKESESITPLYEHDLEKINIVLGFEKFTVKKAGILELTQKPTGVYRELINLYLKNELGKLQALETKMRGQVEETVNRYHRLSVFVPTTYYRSVTEEISSRGYINLVKFYEYLYKQKTGFVKYILHKAYFSEDKKIQSYIKGDENVFYASSTLPPTFIPGMIIMVLQILGLTWLSNFLYKRRVYREPSREIRRDDIPPVKLTKKCYAAVNISNDDFKRRVYNILSGRKTAKTVRTFSKRVFIDDTDLVDLGGKKNFIYLCQPSHVPGDYTVDDLISLAAALVKLGSPQKKRILQKPSIKPILDKRFDKLDNAEKNEVLFQLIDIKRDDIDIYIIDDTGKDMPIDFAARLSEKFDTLSKRGAYVLYLTSGFTPNFTIPGTSEGYYPHSRWHQYIDDYKLKKITPP